jgi:glycolate oxidase FAD binding subunit
VASFASAEQALELRHVIAHSPLRPQAVEILSSGAARILRGDVAARITPGPSASEVFSKVHWTLAADFSGNEKVLDRCERDLRQMGEKCGGESFVVLSPDQMLPAASRKREFIPIALASSPAATIVKMGVLPTRMNEVLASAARAAETNSLPWAAIARGVGVIYFTLLPKDRSDETRLRVIQATDQILFECAGLGGYATIPWSPAEWKSSLKVWGLERGDLDLMRKLKTLFDPSGTVSPGRFVGGL